MFKVSLFLFILLTLNPTTSVASDSSFFKIDYARIHNIVIELDKLKDIGFDMLEKYNTSILDEYSKCVNNNRQPIDTARKLHDEVLRIPEILYKSGLRRATRDTIACLNCKGDSNACMDIPPQLAEIKELLRRDGYLKPIKEPKPWN